MNHYSQTYAPQNIDWSVFEAAWKPSLTITNLPSDTSTLAMYGIDFSAARNMPAASVAQGKYSSMKDTLEWIRAHLGENSARIVDMGQWFVSYLLYVLNHASTDKTENTGSFTVVYMLSTETNEELWSTFMGAYIKWCADRGQGGMTPRTLQITLDPLLLETWGSNAPAIAAVRSQGTRRSNHYFTSTNARVEAWMCVPDLFLSMRPKVPRDVMAVMNSYARLDESAGSAYSTLLDQSGESAKRTHFHQHLLGSAP